MVRLLLATIGALIALSLQVKAEEIHIAARKGDVAAIEKLLSEGVVVDLPSTRNTSRPGVTALYVASQFGHIEAARVLLLAGADPAVRPIGDETDGTPIHMAARRGSVEIVKMLLDEGVDPNIYDRWQGTALHQALLNDHDEVASLLVSRGAETEWQAPPIFDLMADADVENGRAAVKGCAGLCHTADANVKERSLWDIVGAPKASRPGYEYSHPLKSLGGNWSLEELNSWLAAPSRYAPGSRMGYSVPDDETRADVLAYLRTLSDNP